MKKQAELYRGKAKTVYSTDNPDLLVLEFRNDTSAGDGARIEQTVKELRAMGLSVLGLSHCSGRAAEEYLRACGGLEACHMATGDLVAVR